MKRLPFSTNQVYHICNRGVNKGNIFFSPLDFRRFLETALHYKYHSRRFSDKFSLPRYRSADTGSGDVITPKVEILAYCLMPNHFHLLLKQIEEDGIRWYMQHLINSYVHFVNTKYDRVGPLLQGRFRSILMTSDEQLLHVVRYIHLNPVVANLIENPTAYTWSSHKDYVSESNNLLVDKKFILGFFSNIDEFKNFVVNHIEYARSLEAIKKSII